MSLMKEVNINLINKQQVVQLSQRNRAAGIVSIG